MYVQITTRCNMSCAHCGFSCGPEGEDMKFSTFKKAVALDPYAFLGGGEPTVHPKFWNFLLYVLRQPDFELGTMGVVTNGKKKVDALILAGMAQAGLIYASLSQDKYHEPVDREVIKAFTKPDSKDLNFYSSSHGETRDLREIRTGLSLINSGRCDFGEEDRCFCPEVIVKPNGQLKFCACDYSPIIGDVSTGIQEKYQEILDEYGNGCWKDYQKIAA